jgi:hypothetical protein
MVDFAQIIAAFKAWVALFPVVGQSATQEV